jgi:hypothetical protein
MKEKEMIMDTLIKAIDNVQKHYYGIKNPTKENVQKGYARKRVFPERNFCTNLSYHFLKEINNSDLAIDIGKKFFLEVEIYKQFRCGNCNNDGKFNKTYEKLKISKIGMRPDLVLHKSQQKRSIQGQLLILECKIEPNLEKKNFNKDYFKLNIYKSIFNFQNSVYLIVNNDEDKVREYLSKYKEEYWNTPNGEIEILIKKNYESELFRI